MVEDVDRRRGNDLDGAEVALEVGDEHFDPAVGEAAPDRTGGRHEVCRPAVGEIISIDRGDDDVPETEPCDGFGDAHRLREVDRERLPVGDRAERAVPGARVPQEHESRGLMAPTLTDIRAARLLTDRMQAELLHRRHGLAKPCTAGGPDFEPRGKAPHHGRAHAVASWSDPSKGSQPAYPNTDTKRETTSGITPATSSGPPSASMDVISTPAIPHGVMASKPPRSRATLRANPCQVTHRLIATPTDAILRPSHHTPARPGRRSAAMSRSASTRMSTSSRPRTYQPTSGRRSRSPRTG